MTLAHLTPMGNTKRATPSPINRAFPTDTRAGNSKISKGDAKEVGRFLREFNSKFTSFTLVSGIIGVNIADLAFGTVTLALTIQNAIPLFEIFGYSLNLPPVLQAFIISLSASFIQTLIWMLMFKTYKATSAVSGWGNKVVGWVVLLFTFILGLGVMGADTLGLDLASLEYIFNSGSPRDFTLLSLNGLMMQSVGFILAVICGFGELFTTLATSVVGFFEND